MTGNGRLAVLEEQVLAEESRKRALELVDREAKRFEEWKRVNETSKVPAPYGCSLCPYDDDEEACLNTDNDPDWNCDKYIRKIITKREG